MRFTWTPSPRALALLIVVPLSSPATALLGFAAEAPPRLDFEPGIFADDPCLAPSFDQPGCVAGAASRPIDRRASASAALLPWDMPLPEPEPLLAFDKAVLEASVEVTFSCAPGGCPPGTTAGTD